ncbi:MAG: zinc metallopeptidase, partial [Planctomycetota bacterium]
VAAHVLRASGVEGVSIEPVKGYLSDHFDARRKVLRLSPEVFHGRSIAAFGVAAHESGHAIQQARGFAPLALRNLAVPTASLGSSLGMPLILVGLLLPALFPLAVAGLVLFSAVVLFQLVTLPVEIDASRRAVQALSRLGLVGNLEEERGIKAVLTAAALTYLAAALVGIVWLLYYGSLVLGGRRS